MLNKFYHILNGSISHFKHFLPLYKLFIHCHTSFLSSPSTSTCVFDNLQLFICGPCSTLLHSSEHIFHSLSVLGERTQLNLRQIQIRIQIEPKKSLRKIALQGEYLNELQNIYLCPFRECVLCVCESG